MIETLTVASGVCSVVGAIVSIWAAWKAVSVRKAVRLDYHRMVLGEVAHTLRRLQDELNIIDDAIKDGRRGFKLGKSLKEVRRHLDSALNRLAPAGEDKDIRGKVIKVQSLFRGLEDAGEKKVEVTGAIRGLLQESISVASNRAFVRIPNA